MCGPQFRQFTIICKTADLVHMFNHQSNQSHSIFWLFSNPKTTVDITDEYWHIKLQIMAGSVFFFLGETASYLKSVVKYPCLSWNFQVKTLQPPQKLMSLPNLSTLSKIWRNPTLPTWVKNQDPKLLDHQYSPTLHFSYMIFLPLNNIKINI